MLLLLPAHLLCLLGQLGQHVNLAPPQQVGRHQVPQHQRTLVGRGDLVLWAATCRVVMLSMILLTNYNDIDWFDWKGGCATQHTRTPPVGPGHSA